MNTSSASARIADKHEQGQYDAARSASSTSHGMRMRIHTSSIGPEELSWRVPNVESQTCRPTPMPTRQSTHCVPEMAQTLGLRETKSMSQEMITGGHVSRDAAQGVPAIIQNIDVDAVVDQEERSRVDHIVGRSRWLMVEP